jgi:hypothetical protein
MNYKKEALLAGGTSGISAGMTMLMGDGDLIRGIILVALGVGLLAFRGYCKKYEYSTDSGRKKIQGGSSTDIDIG